MVAGTDQPHGIARASMTIGRHRHAFAILFAALQLLAAIVVGFAPHAVAGVRVGPDPASTAFVLPDGSRPSICGTDAPAGSDHAAAGSICAACLLAAAPGLPPPADGVALPDPGRPRWDPPPPTTAAVGRTMPRAQPRGPPGVAATPC